MTHYIGLDAHSKTCTAVVSDANGKILEKHHFPTSEKHLLEFVKSVKRPRILAFEEMNLAQWLFVLLKEHVDDIAIAHAPHLRKQRGPKTDLVDAIRLATELRCGTINRVHHEDSKLWDLRALVASHQDFAQALTGSKNRYKSFLRSRGMFVTGSTVFKDMELLKQIPKDHDRFVATNMFEHLRLQQEIRDSYEDRFQAIAKQWPVISKLCTIPGIGALRACIITAIICSPQRFPNKHKLWSYAMLVRHTEISDGKIYGSKKVRGRSELKAVFMGAATRVLQSGNSGLRRYYDKLRTDGVTDKEAKKSVARRIAAIALMIMKSGNGYDDKHEEKRRRLETVVEA